MEEIEAIEDKDIDYSDIPETDADFSASANIIEPNRTEHITIRIKISALDYFKEERKKGIRPALMPFLKPL